MRPSGGNAINRQARCHRPQHWGATTDHTCGHPAATQSIYKPGADGPRRSAPFLEVRTPRISGPIQYTDRCVSWEFQSSKDFKDLRILKTLRIFEIPAALYVSEVLCVNGNRRLVNALSKGTTPYLLLAGYGLFGNARILRVCYQV